MRNSVLWKIDRVIARFFLWLLTLYQKVISPMVWVNRSAQHEDFRCKFYPTCSEYSRQSFERDWSIVAFGKTVWRLLRCNPWSKGGIDFPHKTCRLPKK